MKKFDFEEFKKEQPQLLKTAMLYYLRAHKDQDTQSNPYYMGLYQGIIIAIVTIGNYYKVDVMQVIGKQALEHDKKGLI